jgi:hypothetical protein
VLTHDTPTDAFNLCGWHGTAGGFKAWAAADLPVLEDETEYDASTGAVLSDNVEVLAEKANEAVKTVSQPQVRVGTVKWVLVRVGCMLKLRVDLV